MLYSLIRANRRIVGYIPAKEGKANAAIVKVLAEHLDIPKSRIRLIVGQGYRGKVFSVGLKTIARSGLD